MQESRGPGYKLHGHLAWVRSAVYALWKGQFLHGLLSSFPPCSIDAIFHQTGCNWVLVFSALKNKSEPQGENLILPLQTVRVVQLKSIWCQRLKLVLLVLSWFPKEAAITGQRREAVSGWPEDDSSITLGLYWKCSKKSSGFGGFGVGWEAQVGG